MFRPMEEGHTARFKRPKNNTKVRRTCPALPADGTSHREENKKHLKKSLNNVYDNPTTHLEATRFPAGKVAHVSLGSGSAHGPFLSLPSVSFPFPSLPFGSAGQVANASNSNIVRDKKEPRMF